ncbi:MAG: A/G-specific adenine glycosylase [Casimicrobiaceae bacterium]|nr:A/G-specific adenine glycosylase [Casimicrobiaceae bacterium]MDW8311428.1 A/G-specific adenine glycosylase [Burkholderiales bacterium]
MNAERRPGRSTTSTSPGAPSSSSRASFAKRLIAWQRRAGRHDLPWQTTRDPYRIWVAEIMLQQTQVATVLRYYERFVKRFPSVQALAAAGLDEVLTLWAGLGYYGRARNLHAAARKVTLEFAGRFPRDVAGLMTLPGVGRSTAGAIAACAFGTRAPILDGNARRVLARHAGIAGAPEAPETTAALWAEAERRLPRGAQAMRVYTQGLMDLGATCCTVRHPQCDRCPVATDCAARLSGRVADIPPPRRRSPLPLRRQRFLLALHAREVLLVKRPTRGLWGGLWCLPELPARVAATRAARAWGIERCRRRPAPSAFEHAFTHFRLRIELIALEVLARPWRELPPESRWLPLDEIDSAALPRPIMKLLNELAGSPSSP